MIIVSQDKRTILNFDNSTTIRIYKTSCNYGIEACLINTNIADLGEYATEKRAKEVLQEIINYASVSEINDNYQVTDLRLKLAKMCRYEMPKE